MPPLNGRDVDHAALVKALDTENVAAVRGYDFNQDHRSLPLHLRPEAVQVEPQVAHEEGQQAGLAPWGPLEFLSRGDGATVGGR
jgi:hypothetical protein